MAKWAGTLSTTEPYNQLGILKARQGNKNSEVFEFKIVQNGIPYDLSGFRVFFCTHFEPYVSVEKNAEIIDAKKGIIRFTMDDDCMQKIGRQEGYFEIYKEDTFLDATQNFTYTVQTSIIKRLMDGESYIQRLEDLLKKLQEAMDKSQEEVEKWLEENRKKIDDLMKEMDQFFADKKIEFNEWFESVREILESIDPGGILLSEITKARSSERYGTFENLDKRLEFAEAVFAADTKLMSINHNFRGYPKIRVLYWEYGMATRPLEMEPTGIGGGNVQMIDFNVEYLDPYSLVVKVPITYKFSDQELVFAGNKRFRLISDYKVLQVELLEDDVSAYVEQTVTLDFKNKVSGSMVENPHKIIGDRGTALPDPETLPGDTSTAGYKKFAELDGDIVNVVATDKGEIMKIVEFFDIVTDIDRRYPGLFESFGATTREQQVVITRNLVSSVTPVTYGYGSGANGSKLTMQIYNPRSKTWVGNSAHTEATTNKLNLAVDTYYLGDDGFVYTIVYAPASDGATPSVVNIDYVSLEYKLKVGGI